MYFGILTDIIKSVSDLKNFLDFKINGLMAGQSNELLDFLREENRFLKQEIVETRKITNNILENITRQNISSGTPKSNTSITPSLITENNNWITTPKRRSVLKSSKTLDKINNDLISTNRFEALSIDTDFNNFNEQDDNSETVKNDVRDNPYISVEKRKPDVTVNNYPEKQTNFSKHQVNKDTYQKKSIKVFCNSIPKRIIGREFNRCIKHGQAYFKSFPGSTIKQLHYHALPTLLEEKPDIVIIHGGINDILSTRENKTPDNEIAQEILKMGIDCMKHGTEKVFISSITFCKRVDPDRINRVNEMLRNECSKNGFTFIDNNDINKAWVT